MSRRVRMFVLMGISAAMGLALLALIPARQVLLDPAPPSDPLEQVRWITRHPADWKTVSLVSDGSLDSNLPARRELWMASFELARRMSPKRTNAQIGFVRAGLFHWYELAEADRRRVLEVVAPLMRDEKFFGETYVSIWQLTRDFAFLHRVAPDSLSARFALRDVALRYGRFPEYRTMRNEIRAERIQLLETMPRDAPITALLDLVPARLDSADEPLVKRILEELDRRPFNPDAVGNSIEPMVDFAIRHQLQPTTGLRPLIEAPGKLRDVLRARAALHMGDASLATRIEISTAVAGDPQWIPYYLDRARFEARRQNATDAESQLLRAALANVARQRVAAAAEDVATSLERPEQAAAYRRRLLQDRRAPFEWTGTCGPRELCTSAVTHLYLEGSGDEAEIGLSTLQSDETPPYVEIYVDDTLLAEGEVVNGRRFLVQHASRGLHRIEVRLVNERTRNGIQRRMRLS